MPHCSAPKTTLPVVPSGTTTHLAQVHLQDDHALSVRPNLAELTTRDRPADVPVPDALWSRMEQLARLSLVPNSAASRDKEAGADLMKFD